MTEALTLEDFLQALESFRPPMAAPPDLLTDFSNTVITSVPTSSTESPRRSSFGKIGDAAKRPIRSVDAESAATTSHVTSKRRRASESEEPDGGWEFPDVPKRCHSAGGELRGGGANSSSPPRVSTTKGDAGGRNLSPAPDRRVDDYFRRVACTGQPLFAWPRIRPSFLWKLEATMKEMFRLAPYKPSAPQSDSGSLKNIQTPSAAVFVERILEMASRFDGIPFTFQRLCELVTQPLRHYRRADKYFRALEKNVRVVTTVTPTGADAAAEARRPSPNSPTPTENDALPVADQSISSTTTDDQLLEGAELRGDPEETTVMMNEDEDNLPLVTVSSEELLPNGGLTTEACENSENNVSVDNGDMTSLVEPSQTDYHMELVTEGYSENDLSREPLNQPNDTQ